MVDVSVKRESARICSYLNHSPLKRKAKRERIVIDVYSSGVRRLSPNFNTPSSRKKGKRSVTTNATAVGMPTAKMAAPILANTIKAMCFSS